MLTITVVSITLLFIREVFKEMKAAPLNIDTNLGENND